MSTSTTIDAGVIDLPLTEIDRTADTQVRANLSQDAMDELKRLIEQARQDGGLDEFLESIPPVDVFLDTSGRYVLGDGWHRFEAFTDADLATIRARVHVGSERDAFLFACGANRKHGTRRTPADRRRLIEMLLEDAEWVDASSRKIEAFAGVDRRLVEKVRVERDDRSTGAIAPVESNGHSPAPARHGVDGKLRSPRSRPGPSAAKTETAKAAEPPPKQKRGGKEKISPHTRHSAASGLGAFRRLVDDLESSGRRHRLKSVSGECFEATTDEILQILFRDYAKDLGRNQTSPGWKPSEGGAA